MKGQITYIYGLRKQGKVVYVGKSITPKARFIQHLGSHQLKYDDMIILDKFEDMENYWVKKLLSEGCLLENKEKLRYGEEWEVGDIIITQKRSNNGDKKVSVRHIPTQQVFSSIKEATKVFGISRYILNNSIHHCQPNKIQWEYVK
jgi:hypothetical protein